MTPARDHLRSTLPGPVVILRRDDGVIRLPVPPSVNNLFVNVRGKGRVKSREYKVWLDQADKLMKFARHAPVISPAEVSIRVGKCNAQRDLDNLNKPVLDILVHAGIIENDNLNHVHKVTTEKAFGDVMDGWVEVSVKTMAVR